MALFRKRKNRTKERGASGPADEYEGTDPEEATRQLFDVALPSAGTADAEQVEGTYLGWMRDSWGNVDPVVRGDRDAARSHILGFLNHMKSEPGFKYFEVTTLGTGEQHAVDVQCFMDETSRAQRLIAVPMRVWWVGDDEYVATGIGGGWTD